MDRGEGRPAGGDGPSASAPGSAPSSESPSSPGIEALAAEAMASDGVGNEESIDAKVQKALECPCLDDLKKGPCGSPFIDAFSCYLKSTKEEKGSDCVNPFIALQNCIKENKEAFIKEILEEEENDDEADKSNLKVLPPAWSREPSQRNEEDQRNAETSDEEPRHSTDIDRKLGKGKDKIDDEDITFHRMVAKGFWLSTRWMIPTDARALDSDDLLYLKEQMEAEEDAERLLRPVLADSTPAVPVALRVEPKPKSDIRQQDLLKNIVGIKPKRAKVSSPSQPSESNTQKHDNEDSVTKQPSSQNQSIPPVANKESSRGIAKPDEPREARQQNATGSLLGLAYESSDEE
ncbi:hypothetical protein EJB05_51474 [Eragrostis curvula]|uniref:Mitochondrial intermembrane space import and assembly protein 40 homolog n=1 Tax=Eragrostis curvula TaxID=38414 RepID=A0A5J9SVJ7_9POAL|nr:hypothetical protein EJB05_51474 [Eragrostis curvula]